jgi:membrane associated rhomboid family serine protease
MSSVCGVRDGPKWWLKMSTGFGRPPLRETITGWIIAVNVAVAVVGVFLVWSGRPNYVMEYGSLYVPDLFLGRLWEIFTYMWVHAELQGFGILHILFNMMTLAAFGPVVERNLGSVHFLKIYFLGGIVSAIFFIGETLVHMSLGEATVLPLVGASGAVLAICAAFASMFPDTKLFLMFIPFPIKARTVVIGTIVISILFMVLDQGGFIAHSAHLGGLLFGLFYMHRLRGKLSKIGYPVGQPAQEVPITVLERMEDPMEHWNEERLDAEANHVLEKISRYGLHHLTDRDRDILARARRK